MAYQVNNKKIVKNTLALYFRMGFTMIVSFLSTRVTLQVLGVEDFGLNNLVSSVVSLFSFLNASLGTAVQRFYSIEIGKNDSDHLKKTFGCALTLHIGVSLITIVIMEIFAIFFLDRLNIPSNRLGAAQIAFQISVISLAFNVLSVPYSAMLRAREKFSSIAKIDVLQALFRLIILYLLYMIDYDKLVTLSLLNFLISFIYISSLVRLARKDLVCHSSLRYDNDIMMGMIKFFSMLILTVLASLLRDKGIIVLINLFFGLAINAAYAVAMQVMTFANTFVASFKQSIVPQMMASYGYGDIKTMHELINRGTKITFLLLLGISSPLLFESEYILRIWLETPPGHTAELVRLALINVNISSFTYFLYQGVHATGKIMKQQCAYSLLYMLNVLLIFLFFKFGFNYNVALYITIMISILQCATNLYFSKKVFSYNLKGFVWSVFIRCIITVGLFYVAFQIVGILFELSFLRFVVSLIVCFLLSLFVGFYIVLEKNEREYVIKMFHKKKI